jgi:ParB family chromosome partitioning protein
METKSRKALHRGLQALISKEALEEKAEDRNPLMQVSIKQIFKNPFQPRKYFDDEALEGLKKSIKKHGVIEPVILRKSKGKYELVSGERRYNAVKSLGIEHIPAVIREKVSDREMKILALVENQQREDLNDIEIAMGYNELINRYNYTHGNIANDTGKSRSFVTNTLRLLKLPEKMRAAIIDGKMTAGHARAILAVEGDRERNELFQKIIQKSLSVRQAEEMLNQMEKQGKKKPKPAKSDNIISLEEKLTKLFKTKVEIINKRKKGKIIIKFMGIKDLNRIISILESK